MPTHIQPDLGNRDSKPTRHGVTVAIVLMTLAGLSWVTSTTKQNQKLQDEQKSRDQAESAAWRAEADSREGLVKDLSPNDRIFDPPPSIAPLGTMLVDLSGLDIKTAATIAISLNGNGKTSLKEYRNGVEFIPFPVEEGKLFYMKVRVLGKLYSVPLSSHPEKVQIFLSEDGLNRPGYRLWRPNDPNFVSFNF